MVVDRGTILEWPQIEALARSYFERLGREYQDRKDEATWYVARRGERVAGAYAMRIFDETAQIWITDMYRSDDFDGARAIVCMYRDAYAKGRELGFDVIFTVDPANTAWIDAIKRYGDAELVGLVYCHRV